MASTNSKTQNFRNLRYQVNAETRLSMSHWEQDGFFTCAVALIVGSKVQHETAVEVRRKCENDASYVAVCYATDLVKVEYAKMGQEMPLRFFRDNGV